VLARGQVAVTAGWMKAKVKLLLMKLLMLMSLLSWIWTAPAARRAHRCNHFSPTDAHADDDVPAALSIPRGLLSVSDLINAPVAESTPMQYTRDNADFMMYWWDDRPQLLSIPAMEFLNRACPTFLF
jgi:hypothetical protein